MITIYAIHYSYLPDHVFIRAYDKFVATQLLKNCDSLKANRSKLLSTF